jgi:leucyl aminopeptidase
MNGWIKIHRQLKEKAYYKDSEFIHLWLHLLLCANHNNGEYLNGYEIIKLKKGQFVTGRKKLSLETGISESKIERILKVFESEQQIEQQTNSRSRVISILSWDKYQQSEQQTDSIRTASEQQVDTNNNDNNKKNDKKINTIPTFFEFLEYAKTLENYHPNLEQPIKTKYNSWVANDWHDGKNNKIKNWKSKLISTLPYIAKENPISTFKINFPR